MSRRPHYRGNAGFTLLETLVALAILGIVLTTVFAVIGNGLRTAHRDEDRLLLGLVAQNLLTRSRLDLTTTDGPRHGDIGGGLTWRIESEPYTLPEDILPPPPDPDANRGLKPAGGEDGETGAGGETGPGGDSKPFGAEQSTGAEKSTFGGDRADRQQSESGGTRTAMGDRSGAAGAELGQDRPGKVQPKEDLRLRLVRVTVEKAGQRFELTGLAIEPRRERTGAL